jgi:hypothetical protein
MAEKTASKECGFVFILGEERVRWNLYYLAATGIHHATDRLTKNLRLMKAEPPPTRDGTRDSGTASANGGWLRREAV